MKSAKELLENLKNDPAFANEVADKLETKKNAGAEDVIQACVEVANELGFEVTAENIQALKAADSKELTMDELGDVAGGYVFNPGGSCNPDPNQYEVINDKTGAVMEGGLTWELARQRAESLGQSKEPITWEFLDNLRKNPLE